MKDLNKFGITKELIRDSLQTASQVLNLIGTYTILSEKVKSEIVSGVVEKSLSESLTEKLGFEVKSPKSDNDPDLLFTDFPEGENSVEIKVAYMPNGRGQWRGGSFSKRDAPHILIARNHNLSEVYVAFLHISPEDWVEAKSDNYYAHTMSKKELINREDNIVFFGSISRVLKKDGMPSNNQIKMKMETMVNDKSN